MPLSDQKEFYRKLDALISKIEIDGIQDKRGLLFAVLSDLVESFGALLSIQNGRLYEIVGDVLILREEKSREENSSRPVRIPLDYPPIQLLLRHRCYIFDGSTPGLDPELESGLTGGANSVAIIVGRERESVLAFGLADGWDRDKIEFGLNTVRNALTHKIDTADLRADLEETRMIQRSLFPKRIPEFPGYEIAGRVESADSVGGDFFDFIPMGEDIIGIAVGDASGHGLPAALLVRDLVTGLRMGVEKDMKITPTLSKLNQVIHRSTLSTKFVSLFYGELEQNGNLMYVNAGHLAPYLLLERGFFRLEVGGTVIGPLPEVEFKRGFAHVDRGGIFVAFSDGIVERANASDDQFGEERLARVIRDNRDRSAQELLEAIFQASKAHGVGRLQDDATVLVVRRLP